MGVICLWIEIWIAGMNNVSSVPIELSYSLWLGLRGQPRPHKHVLRSVLEMRLPKAEKAETKHIEIKAK